MTTQIASNDRLWGKADVLSTAVIHACNRVSQFVYDKKHNDISV